MKKNSLGFVLTETLIVSAVVAFTLVILYAQFRKINTNYNISFKYNNTDDLFVLNNIKTLIADIKGYDSSYNILADGSEWKDITASINYSEELYDQLISKSNIKVLIYTNINCAGLKNDIDDTSYDGSFKMFIKNIDSGYTNGHRLVAQFNDGTFANIIVDGTGTTRTGSAAPVEVSEGYEWQLTTDKNGNGKADPNDVITMKTENFYVMSNDGTNIKALAKYNLLVGYYYDGLGGVLENPTGLQDPTAIGDGGWYATAEKPYLGTIGTGERGYYLDSDYNLKSKYGTTYPAFVYGEDSGLYSYNNDYLKKLKKMGAKNIQITLISFEELEALGCDYSKSTCKNAKYSWIYSTTYWTGSANEDDINCHNDCMVAVENPDSRFIYAQNTSAFEGLRPVIIIPVSELKDKD